jgi:type II secretory pathway component PulF
MTIFQYVSIAQDGRKRSGRIEADSEPEARRLVTSAGDLLIDLSESTRRSWFRLERRKPLSLQEAADFAQELSGLLSAGAPLKRALGIQSEATGTSARLARSISAQIDNGASLSRALLSAGGAAGLLAEFASAGEQGAGLDRLLKSGGHFLSARHDAVSRIRAALAYPAFILVLGLMALATIMLLVAPALAPILEQSGQTGLVSWLAQLGSWLQARSQWGALLLAALVAAGWLALRQPIVRRHIWDRLLSLPWLGEIARDLDAGQSCDILSALLDSGRPLESALRFSAGLSGPRLSRAYANIARRIRDGKPAGSAFLAESALPIEVRRLAHLGEKSSGLPAALHQAGQICHRRAMRRIDRFAALIGPVLVIGMGCAVAVLMLSILGSLSSLGDTIQ